jgi:hypothetical protein
MPRFTVAIDREFAQELIELARRERRSAGDQAGYVVERYLEARRAEGRVNQSARLQEVGPDVVAQ